MTEGTRAVPPATPRTPRCIEPERLAAYVDGGLESSERHTIEAHLAECEDCYHVFSETLRFLKEVETSTTAPSSRSARPSTRIVGATALAVAASLILVTYLALRPGVPGAAMERPELQELVAAVGPERLFEPRLTGGFQFGPLRTPVRGQTESRLRPEVVIAAARLEQHAQADRTVRNLAAFGAAALVAGRTDEALDELEAAVALEPGNPAYLTDLAAAYLVAADTSPDRKIELATKALDAAERAIALRRDTPEAWFNRALAIERLPPAGRAEGAWREYLQVETDARWKDEVRDRIDDDHTLKTPDPQPAACDHPDPDERHRTLDDKAQTCREWLDRTLWPQWAGAHLRGDVAAAAELRRTGCTVAAELASITGDQLPIESVQAIGCGDGQAEPARARQVADAYQTLALARVRFESDDLERARELLSRAERLFTAARTPAALLADADLTLLLYRQRNLEEVRLRTLRARDVAARSAYRTIEARSRWLFGMERWQTLHPQEALEQLNEAVRVFEDAGEFDAAAQVKRVLADFYRNLGDRRQAWDLINAALARVEAISQPLNRYLTYFEASLFALHEGMLSPALHYQSAAVDAARATGLDGALAESLIRRADILTRLGRPDEADADLTRARAHLEAAPNDYLEAEWRISAASLSEATRPAEAAGLLSHPIEAFASSEPMELPKLLLARARAYERAGRFSDAERDLLRAIELADSQRVALSLSLQARYSDVADDAFRAMVGLQVRRLNQPDLAFMFAERGRARALLDAASGDRLTQPLTLREFQARLPADVAAISFTALDDQLLIWNVTRDRSELIRKPVSRVQLAEAVRGYRQAIITARRPGDSDRWAVKLFDLVVPASVSRTTAVRRLVFIPDAELHLVPFAHLRNPATSRHLLEDFEIGSAPSATLLIKTSAALERRAAGGTPESLLNVAASSPSPTLYPRLPVLHFAAQEAREIGQLYERRTDLIGGNATPSRFLAEIGRHDVVHVAGHAIANEDVPELSGLLLMPDADGEPLLLARDIDRSRPRLPRLVVLAACSTGVGRMFGAEGPMHLARPFLAAGVPAVVVSVWDIEDYPTRELFRRFHRYLASGDGPAAALRRAQLDLMAAEASELSDPRSWAAFSTVGAMRMADKN